MFPDYDLILCKQRGGESD